MLTSYRPGSDSANRDWNHIADIHRINDRGGAFHFVNAPYESLDPHRAARFAEWKCQQPLEPLDWEHPNFAI
jgi:hypothetical protein